MIMRRTIHRGQNSRDIQNQKIEMYDKKIIDTMSHWKVIETLISLSIIVDLIDVVGQFDRIMRL